MGWTSRAITSPRPTTGARTAIAASPRPRGRGRPSSWSTRFTTIGGEQINDDNETRSPTLRRAGLRPQWRSHVGQTYPIPNKPIAPKRFHPTSKIFSAVTYFCVIVNTPKGRDAAAGPNCRKSSDLLLQARGPRAPLLAKMSVSNVGAAVLIGLS